MVPFSLKQRLCLPRFCYCYPSALQLICWLIYTALCNIFQSRKPHLSSLGWSPVCWRTNHSQLPWRHLLLLRLRLFYGSIYTVMSLRTGSSNILRLAGRWSTDGRTFGPNCRGGICCCSAQLYSWQFDELVSSPLCRLRSELIVPPYGSKSIYFQCCGLASGRAMAIFHIARHSDWLR